MRRQILVAAVVLGLVAGLFTPAAPVQGSTGAKVYWTDGNNGGTATAKVSRANLDGSNPEALVVPAASGARFIALDPIGGKMYWIDGGTIRRADINGGPEETFIAGLPGPVGIALDATGRHIYWTDIAARTIHRANLDDTSVRIQLTVLGQPRALALDVAAGKIYWTERATPRIRRANLDLDGTSVETLVPTAGLLIEGIAVDPVGGKVYWADVSLVDGFVVSRIRRANLDGTDVQDIVVIPAMDGVPASLVGVALDADGSKVYWTVFWTGTTAAKIQRANLEDMTVEDVVTGLDTPWGIALHFSVQPVLQVGIDIKPGGLPNSINPASHGTIPVAVLSTADFRAPAVVDPASLTFGRTGAEASLAFCNGTPEDVNGDGLPDLICHFFTDGTGFQAGDTQGILRGRTLDSQEAFEGADSVRIIY